MIKLFKEYFQKSKVFLYPLLKIPKGSKYVPVETYMHCNSKQYADDTYKLFCVYKGDGSRSYEAFETIKLLKNELFVDYKDLGDNFFLYVFDLTVYPQTWLAVSEGLYSKINEREKTIIGEFFGVKGLIVETVESYLYPEFYWEDYAELLAVPEEMIKDVGELCDAPNVKKETFVINPWDKDDIVNNSISLHSNNQ